MDTKIVEQANFWHFVRWRWLSYTNRLTLRDELKSTWHSVMQWSLWKHYHSCEHRTHTSPIMCCNTHIWTSLSRIHRHRRHCTLRFKFRTQCMLKFNYVIIHFAASIRNNGLCAKRCIKMKWKVESHRARKEEWSSNIAIFELKQVMPLFIAFVLHSEHIHTHTHSRVRE